MTRTTRVWRSIGVVWAGVLLAQVAGCPNGDSEPGRAQPPTLDPGPAAQSAGEASVELIARKSIAGLRLGVKKVELPAEATIDGAVGSYRDVRFTLDDGVVTDVWIDDLRTFPRELRVDGKELAKQTSIEALVSMFGPCTEVLVLGGTFFNCDAGITLGCDAEGQGSFVQLRLKPR